MSPITATEVATIINVRLGCFAHRVSCEAEAILEKGVNLLNAGRVLDVDKGEHAAIFRFAASMILSSVGVVGFLSGTKLDVP